MHAFLAIIVAIVPFLFGNVNAFFRMRCSLIQQGRIDPVVNPGALAAHSHSIVGGSSKSDSICNIKKS